MGGLLLDLTLGFVFVLALSSSAAYAAGTVWRGKPRQTVQHSFRPGAKSRAGPPPSAREALKYKPQFAVPSYSRKSAFRSASC